MKTTELCGALSKSTGQPCKNIAGKGTSHIGQERCRWHGGATPSKHGRYSKIRQTRLGKVMAEIVEREDLMQSYEEVALAKALLEQTIERHQILVDALSNWYGATRSAFQILMDSNDAFQIRDAIQALRAEEPSRPSEIPDLLTITTAVDRISRIQERIRKGARVCTREELDRILRRLGETVAEHVTDEETRQKIHDGWNSIAVKGQ